MIPSLFKRINADILFLLGSFILFTLIAFYYGIKSSIYYSFEGVPVYWFHLSYHYLASGWTWALMMPLVLALTKTLYGKNLFIPIVIILALPIGVTHRSVALFSDTTFRWIMGYTTRDPIVAMIDMKQVWVTGIFDSVIVYFVIIIMITIYNGEYVKSFKWESEVMRIKALIKSLSLVTPDSFDAERQETERLVVKKNGRWIFIKIQDINWFKSEGNYQKIFYEDSWVMIRETMKDMQQKLDPNQFYRINRSTIVNINFIKEFEPWFNGEYTVTLLDGSKINTSKTYRTVVNQLLQTS